MDFKKKDQKITYDAYTDLHEMLKGDNLKMMTYGGSLTTPTCDELVRFYIVDKVYDMSASQLQDFRDMFNNNNKFANSVGNYRKIMPTNNRKVQKGTVSVKDGRPKSKNARHSSLTVLALVMAILLIAMQ